MEFQRSWWTKLTPDAPAPLPCRINMRVIPRLQARRMLPLYGQRPSDLPSSKSFHVPHKNKYCPAEWCCHIITISHRDCISHVPRMLQHIQMRRIFTSKATGATLDGNQSKQEGTIDYNTTCGPFPSRRKKSSATPLFRNKRARFCGVSFALNSIYCINQHLRDDSIFHQFILQSTTFSEVFVLSFLKVHFFPLADVRILHPLV